MAYLNKIDQMMHSMTGDPPLSGSLIGRPSSAAERLSDKVFIPPHAPLNSFQFKPGQYVLVTLLELNYRGRVQRCIWDTNANLYDVEYTREGHIERREFAEDELKAV